MAKVIGTNISEFLNGSADRDWIFAHDGDDHLQGGRGGDFIFGGSGENYLEYSDLDQAVWIHLERGGSRSGADVDRFASVEHAIGTKFDDRMIGTTGTNLLDGGDGDDLIWASAGDDVVQGGAGDDYLKGGFGNDLIDGGAGDDFITAGSAAGEVDTIIFRASDGDDVVEGFDVDLDQLGLVGLTADQLAVLDTDTGTLVQASSGDSIFLIGVHDIGVGDLILV